MTEEAKCHL